MSFGWPRRFPLPQSLPAASSGRAHRDVTSEPLCGSFSQRHDAIALAFAQPHGEPKRGCIHVVEIQFVNLSMADTGRVQDFHQRPIAQANGGRYVWSFDEPDDL